MSSSQKTLDLNSGVSDLQRAQDGLLEELDRMFSALSNASIADRGKPPMKPAAGVRGYEQRLKLYNSRAKQLLVRLKEIVVRSFPAMVGHLEMDHGNTMLTFEVSLVRSLRYKSIRKELESKKMSTILPLESAECVSPPLSYLSQVIVRSAG
jgi:hypothetical protein